VIDTPLPGRPKDKAKRDAVVLAARNLFFSRGFRATSIEAIAEAAGVSKVTVYGHFGDKAGIFEAVVQNVASRMETKMSAAAPPEADLSDTLIAFGCGLMGELMNEEMMLFERHMGAELAQHPALAKRFFEAGPGYMRLRLEKIIAAAHDRGEITVDDAKLAAHDLFGLWQGFDRAEAHFGIAQTLTADMIRTRVIRAVKLFLRAYEGASIGNLAPAASVISS
jgi:TetR/AcrR family transcriptional regulator, mexJK operon transcriptional repressor